MISVPSQTFQMKSLLFPNLLFGERKAGGDMYLKKELISTAFLFRQGFPCSSGWPGTCYVDLAGLS